VAEFSVSCLIQFILGQCGPHLPENYCMPVSLLLSALSVLLMLICMLCVYLSAEAIFCQLQPIQC